jgi:hypothetical protein
MPILTPRTSESANAAMQASLVTSAATRAYDQATLAAAVLCTSPGMRRSSLTLTKAECAVGRRM